MVTVVLDQAQFFAAHHGLDGWMAEARGTPVEWSFCALAVASGEPFVVEDATTHPLTRDNPLVANEGIRCYAGIPLVSSRGYALGTLCVIGKESRSFSDADLDVLRELAEKAVWRIEERRIGGGETAESRQGG
jgi:GAF domain-containing protein